MNVEQACAFLNEKIPLVETYIIHFGDMVVRGRKMPKYVAFRTVGWLGTQGWGRFLMVPAEGTRFVSFGGDDLDVLQEKYGPCEVFEWSEG